VASFLISPEPTLLVTLLEYSGLNHPPLTHFFFNVMTLRRHFHHGTLSDSKGCPRGTFSQDFFFFCSLLPPPTPHYVRHVRYRVFFPIPCVLVVPVVPFPTIGLFFVRDFVLSTLVSYTWVVFLVFFYFVVRGGHPDPIQPLR